MASTQFAQVIAPYITETVRPDFISFIRIFGFRALYERMLYKLNWPKEQKMMFELGPLAYPEYKTFIDRFENNDARKAYCYKWAETHPIAIEEYAKNKLYHEHIKNVVRYGEIFMPDNPLLIEQMAKVRTLYNYDDAQGKYDLQQQGPEQKKEVAKAVTELAILIVEIELCNLN